MVGQRRFGVIADTHLRNNPVRANVLEALHGVDLILHAGDVSSWQVLDQLSGIAPVLAVRGNNDDEEVRKRLPSRLAIHVGGSTILLIHGDERASAVKSAQVEAARMRPGDCVVFGHSHRVHQERSNGVLLFNPGSPTSPRFSSVRTYGILTVRSDGGVTAEIHQL